MLRFREKHFQILFCCTVRTKSFTIQLKGTEIINFPGIQDKFRKLINIQHIVVAD